MLQLSTKIRYGVRALLEIAEHQNEHDSPLMISVIAERQDLSVKYLENLMSLLKTAGIVRSVRGKNGGYLLTRPAPEISVHDVITAVEGPVSVAPCTNKSTTCERFKNCPTTFLWQEITDHLRDKTTAVSLSDLLHNPQYGHGTGEKT